jgi:pimeloyl-ACP methyl ester carboxylesterase
MDRALYPSEVLDVVANFPALYHYQPAKRSIEDAKVNPLIVCVPGGLHLARIFYGGHAGSRPTDFLSHWLSELGYGVLSLSYPLETEPEIMAATAARYRIKDWGEQAAKTAAKVMSEHNLPTRSVVLISWSMGGRMVVPFTIAAKQLGLDVVQYISFAATPGFSSNRPLPPGLSCSPAGYFQVPAHLGVFWRQLSEMQDLNGGREIVPEELYLRQYVGGTPINLIGLGLKYDGQGNFVQDEIPHEEDSRVLDIANFPLITALYPTSSLDASHALADRASWGFLLTYKLESMIGKAGVRQVQGTPKWQQLMDLVHSAPARLCLPVTGNHFFFVGEKSARDVASRVDALIRDATGFQNQLLCLVS